MNLFPFGKKKKELFQKNFQVAFWGVHVVYLGKSTNPVFSIFRTPVFPDRNQLVNQQSTTKAQRHQVHEITMTMMVFATWHGDSLLRPE
jgi:hypothetical protein